MNHHAAMVLVAAVVQPFIAAAEPPRQQSAPPQSVSSSCPVAQDDQYAYSKDQPVQVGGSPMYGAARERRYLDALRGPQGQPVKYKRLGSTTAHGPTDTILDEYELTYDGLEKPAIIYLDWYHFNPQRAPRGFLCGQAIGLGIPPVSPFQESEDVEFVALTQGASRDFAPIPLDAEGATTHGVVFDRFRLLALAARGAAASGKSIVPSATGLRLPEDGSIVLAYPLKCDDRVVRATAIDVVAPNGAVMPKSGQHDIASGNVSRALPGVQIPDGTLAVAVMLTRPRPNDSFRIAYAGPVCGATTNEISLPMKFSAVRGVEMPQPRLPAGAPADQPVLLQVVVDADGAVQRPTYVGGPTELTNTATDTVRRWRFEPARINGAPLPLGVLVQVRFVPAQDRSTGR